MGQMLYQSNALIELGMKIFFSKFSDHFVQSYKRSKFRGWVAWGPKAPKRRAGGPPSLGARAEGPSLRSIPKWVARAEGPSFDPSLKAEQRLTEAEGRGV